MSEKDCVDKLKRALLMEEEMAAQLVELCAPESLPEDIPDHTRQRVAGVLTAIKSDTLRHQKAVRELIERSA